MSMELHDRVIQVTRKYLGPASKRFVHRQINMHLDKHPKELTKKDIPQLADWAKIALGLITKDKGTVDAYHKELLALGPAKSTTKATVNRR